MSGVATNPEINKITVADTTSAVANGIKTTAVLAAPGAGLRYRIYGIWFTFDLSVSTPAAVNTGIMGRLGLFSFSPVAISWSQQPAIYVALPSQGIPMSNNGPLNWQTWPSAAVVGGIPFQIAVAYVIESI